MLEVIKNQPIQTKFNCCKTNDEYELMQVVQTNDQQRLQVKLSPFAIAPVINSGWVIEYGIAFIWNGGITLSVNGASIRTNVAVVANRRYRVQFTVQFLMIDNNGGYRVSLNGQWLKLPDAASGAYSILGGIITTYVTINPFFPFNPPRLIFQTTGSTIIQVRGVTVSELSKCALVVLNDAKTIVQDFGESLTIYQRDSNIATVVIDWKNITGSGLRYLALYDPRTMGVNVITNGTFNSNLNGWTNELGTILSPFWQWSAGKAAYVGTVAPVSPKFAQNLNLIGGSIYRLTMNMTNIGILENFFVYFLVNGVQVAKTPAILVLFLGYWELDLTGYTGFVNGFLVFDPGPPNSSTFEIDNIVMSQYKDENNLTNPFKLGDNHPQTLKLLGICNKSAFGFDFTNFISSMRVKGSIKYKEYPDVTELYDFSNDVAEILDSAAKKYYEVTINGNPEYIHDAVRIIRLCDYFFINGKEYIKEGGYEVKQTEGVMSSGATFLVREKIGVPENYYAPGYLDPKYIGG